MILVITTSRADYTPLKSVIAALGINNWLEASGLADCGVEEYIERHHPNIVLVLGDMYRTLIHAAMAVKHGARVAHCSGGDTTPGSLDDYYRNAITMLATWHFPSCVLHGKRLEKMGITPAQIFNFGDPAIDVLADAPMSKEECEARLRVKLESPLALVCLHNDEMGGNSANLLRLSAEFQKYKTVIVSGGNSEEINRWWQKLDVHYQPSYGEKLWLSLHHYADALIGNSSGFVFQGLPLQRTRGGKPDILMIGDRQKGRWEEALEMFRHEDFPFGRPGEVGKAIAAKVREFD